MRRYRPTSALKLGATVVAATLLAAACSSSGSSSPSGSGPVTQDQITKAMNTPTTLTFWSWLPDANREVALFEKKYPKIKVNLSNAGQSVTEYTKLLTAIKAGRGEPDVAQVEYTYIGQFVKNLTNLAPYGAGSIKSEFTPSVWKQVQVNGEVLGIPQDTGPMGVLYRTDVLQKAGIAQPTTWAQFATAAKELHQKTGGYLMDFAPSDGNWLLGLLWQAGSKPFGYDGSNTVTVNLDNAADQKFIAYWEPLVKSGAIDNKPDFTDDWFSNLSSGKYAEWMTAAWGPGSLITVLQKTAGLWRAAPLPQADAANPVSSYWGGSSDAVLTSSQHKIAAYELAKFMDTDPASLHLESTLPTQDLFPSQVATLNSPAFVDAKNPLFGGQKVNQVFSQISTTVDPNFQWLPFMDYVYSAFTSTLGNAIANKTSWSAGLQAWQNQVVTYAKQQGFTVKTS